MTVRAVAVFVAIGVLVGTSRESARAAQCQNNLAQIAIAARENTHDSSRTELCPLSSCLSDTFNRPANPHHLSFAFSESPTELARGNYVLNGRTHSPHLAGSVMAPNGDRPTFTMDYEQGEFRWLGNGITGVKWLFSQKGFRNGTSTVVAFEELRARIHPIDPRGVWSFGQAGGSMTWAHDVNGDTYGPNNQWRRSGGVQGSAELHGAVGTKTLLDANMPNVDYLDEHQQATSRSQHGAGVHVAYVDGHVRFVNDAIDPSLWHVLHSHVTQAQALAAEPEKTLLARNNDRRQAPDPFPDAKSAEELPESEVINSIALEFVRFPAGDFMMGVPDVAYGSPPPECPPHPIRRITRALLMGRHEVTQTQFFEVMRRNPSHHTPEVAGVENTDAFPVEKITWSNAHDFGTRLIERAEERPSGRSYRQPTEVKWDYSRRAGENEHRLPTPQAATPIGEFAGVTPLHIGPVGRFQPIPFGVFHMRDNVWERCADWFRRDYYSNSSDCDPQGPPVGAGHLKVTRRSDRCFVGEKCRINYRIMPPSKAQPAIGFRITLPK